MIGARAARRFYREWEDTQTAITLPLILIPIGIAALLMGDAVSKAFTDLGGGPVIRVMGAAMALGGAAAVIGMLSNRPLVEVLGLSLAALGTAIYGTGVLIGLGLLGLMAGVITLGVTLTLLGRVFLIVRAGHVVDQLGKQL